MNHIFDDAELAQRRLAKELLAKIDRLRAKPHTDAQAAEYNALEATLGFHNTLRKSFEAANKAERDAIPVQERRAAEARREAALHKARRAPGGELTEQVIAEIRTAAFQQSRQGVLAPLSTPLRELAHRI